MNCVILQKLWHSIMIIYLIRVYSVFNSKLRDVALTANEIRNERIYRHDFSGSASEPYFGSRQLWELIRKTPRKPGRVLRLARDCISRMKLYCQSIGCDHLGTHYEAWGRVCSTQTIPAGPYCALPNLYLLEPGCCVNVDPGLNCPWISLRSLIETAKLYFQYLVSLRSRSNFWIPGPLWLS